MIDALETWLRARLETISQKGERAAANRYALARWEGLAASLTRAAQLDSNTAERAICA